MYFLTRMMKTVFIVIFPIVISANRLLTIPMIFRYRINMFDNHSTVFRFIHQLTWVSWSFMEVIWFEIDEIVGFCQFNPPGGQLQSTFNTRHYYNTTQHQLIIISIVLIYCCLKVVRHLSLWVYDKKYNFHQFWSKIH